MGFMSTRFLPFVVALLLGSASAILLAARVSERAAKIWPMTPRVILASMAVILFRIWI